MSEQSEFREIIKTWESEEGAPRQVTDSETLEGVAAVREYGPQEMRIVALGAGVPATIDAGVPSKYVDVLFDGSDGLVNIGSYVGTLGGIAGIDGIGVKLGAQGMKQVSLMAAGACTAYLIFNDYEFRVWG